MLNRVLVHIGYHKTASTWLQKELFSPHSDHFFPLAKAGSKKHSKYLATHFIRDDRGHLLSPFQSNKDRVYLEIEKILEEKDLDGRVPVLSNERLTGNPHSGGFDAKAIAERVADCFPNGKIFCMIREQKDMILSTYFQYLRIGGTDSLEEYLRRRYDGRRPGFSPEHLRYVDLLTYYQKLFSPESVLVLPFELFRRDPRRFVSQLGGFVGKEIEVENLDVRKAHNEGRNRVIESKFRYLNLLAKRSSVNGYSPLYTPWLRLPVHRLKRVCSWLVPKERHDRFIEEAGERINAYVGSMYEESNQRLSQLIEMDLSGYGYHS